MQQKKVTLGKIFGKTTRWIFLMTLSKSNVVKIMGGVLYNKFNNSRRLYITQDGESVDEENVSS